MDTTDRIIIALLTNTRPPDLAADLDELARLDAALGPVGDTDPTPAEVARWREQVRARLQSVHLPVSNSKPYCQ